jgi:hypothetical protein
MQAIKDDLEADRFVSQENRCAYERTWLELFYRERASAALVQADDRGRTREKVKLLEDTLKSQRADAELQAKLAALSGHFDWLEGVDGLDRRLNVIRQRSARARLMYKILELTPIMKAGEFQDTAFTNEDLIDFVAYLVANKAAFEHQFGIEVRSDVAKKAVQQLQMVLRLVGLATEQAGRTRMGNKRLFAYRLDMARAGEVMDIIKRREPWSGWPFLEREYGWPPQGGAEESDRDEEK